MQVSALNFKSTYQSYINEEKSGELNLSLNCQSYSAEAKDRDRRPRLNFRQLPCRCNPYEFSGHEVNKSPAVFLFPRCKFDEDVQTDMSSFAEPTSGGAAAEEAGEGRRHVRADLDEVVDVHDGVLREAGDAQKVVERAALGVGESGGAVAQHPRAHREPELGAHVAPRRPAVHALAALPQERRHHRVAHRELLRVLSDALHHPAQGTHATCPFAVSSSWYRNCQVATLHLHAPDDVRPKLLVVLALLRKHDHMNFTRFCSALYDYLNFAATCHLVFLKCVWHSSESESVVTTSYISVGFLQH